MGSRQSLRNRFSQCGDAKLLSEHLSQLQFWWPGTVAPGIVPRSVRDVLATACGMAGAKVPSDPIINSVDLSPVRFGTGPSPQDTMFYYRRRQPLAIRQGAFKAQFRTKATVGDTKEYERDPSENYDIAVKHPDAVAGIMRLRREHESKMIEGEDQLTPRIPQSK